jgi:hypothetical protein
MVLFFVFYFLSGNPLVNILLRVVGFEKFQDLNVPQARYLVIQAHGLVPQSFSPYYFVHDQRMHNTIQTINKCGEVWANIIRNQSFLDYVKKCCFVLFPSLTSVNPIQYCTVFSGQLIYDLPEINSSD